MAKIEKSATFKLILSGIALAAGIGTANAAPVGPLKTFSAGTPAKAADVNGNFTTIVNTVNANDARLTTVETNKQNVVVGGGCPQGSAIRTLAPNGAVTCQSTGGNVGFASVSSAGGVSTTTGVQTGLCIIFCNAFGRFQVSPTGTSLLAVPIQLPHGARMTAFSYTCFCNNANGSTAFILRDDSFLVSVSITTVSTTLQTATTTDFTGVTPGFDVVDNHVSYVVLMGIDGTATSNIIPVRATVTYTLP